ncbi:MAG: hypothetical protein JW950_04030 [Deltaproteobacteria bacterium]|nr:hypothetical protein [Deltaproteobacteria bacterium]
MVSKIRFNPVTNEVEIEGTESFIEENFYVISDLLASSFKTRKPRSFLEPKAEEPPSFRDSPEEKPVEEIGMAEDTKSHDQQPAESTSIAPVHQTFKEKRPPVRKYIRKTGGAPHREQVFVHMKETPEKISIASLKEKFGLSDRQIEAIIREAEREGKIRKEDDGSYVWV